MIFEGWESKILIYYFFFVWKKISGRSTGEWVTLSRSFLKTSIEMNKQPKGSKNTDENKYTDE